MEKAGPRKSLPWLRGRPQQTTPSTCLGSDQEWARTSRRVRRRPGCGSPQANSGPAVSDPLGKRGAVVCLDSGSTALRKDQRRAGKVLLPSLAVSSGSLESSSPPWKPSGESCRRTRTLPERPREAPGKPPACLCGSGSGITFEIYTRQETLSSVYLGKTGLP